MQECNVNIVRFWDNLSNKVQVLFWKSMFFFHTVLLQIFWITSWTTSFEVLSWWSSRAWSLNESSNFNEWCNVNLKFLEVVKKEMEEAKFSKLTDLGSCNLHIVHGAFKTGWGLKSNIKGAFQLLKDLPTWQENYISITRSSFSLLHFCAIR